MTFLKNAMSVLSLGTWKARSRRVNFPAPMLIEPTAIIGGQEVLTPQLSEEPAIDLDLDQEPSDWLEELSGTRGAEVIAPKIEEAVLAESVQATTKESAPVEQMPNITRGMMTDPRSSRDAVVDQLILSLMDDARQRASSTISAYEALSVKVSDYALRSNRSARTAWRLAGSLAVVIAVGGMAGTYAITRAWGKVDQLASNSHVADAYGRIAQHAQSERITSDAQAKMLTNQLSQALVSIQQIQAEQTQTANALREELKEAQEARLQAEEQVRAEQARQAAHVQTSDAARPSAYHPSTKPATGPSASAENHSQQFDDWAALLGERH